jgi:hypothetical protein
VTGFTQMRLAFAAIGIMVWGYGYRADDSRLRWIGIVFLAVAVALRFVPKRFQGDGPEAGSTE